MTAKSREYSLLEILFGALKNCLFVLFIFIFLHNSFANENANDSSSESSFRKGRYVLGLAGSFASGFSGLDSSGQSNFRSQNAFQLSLGGFVQNRWLIGTTFSISRYRSENIQSLLLESLYFGVFNRYYFSKDPTGSLYAEISIGYSSFLDRQQISSQGNLIEYDITGRGVGGIISLGYSVPIKDRVTLDFSLGYSSAFYNDINSNGKTTIPSNDNVTISDTRFAFGFNLLIDKIFSKK